MDRFNLYAKYYDLLYQDKDYNGEVEYLQKLIKQSFSDDKLTLLELGCGTGNHAKIFSEKGYFVEGVDLSSQMIKIAKEKNREDDNLFFFEGDIINYRSKRKFDVVLSLFHVVSYQDTNEKIQKTLQTAHYHLKPDGLFIFDFWYGPGVLTDPPVVREKKLENKELSVHRTATPQVFINDNVVNVLFDIAIKDKIKNEYETISEKHTMRYLFIPELRYMLNNNGFELENYYTWMTLDRPTASTWNVVVVAKKNR